MLQDVSYKQLSLKIHRKGGCPAQLNTCQFELTFRCQLHCAYCYTDCYNDPRLCNTQLRTVQVKKILLALRRAGVLWLCLTGGDPLTRPDFLEIYRFAREQGFIVTIFTNGYSMTRKIADTLAELPPFAVELTLNSTRPHTSDRITGVKDSLPRILQGVEMLRRRAVPLKIKTQVTALNFKEIRILRSAIEKMGFRFNPSIILFPRLNGDTAPCSLRISPRQIIQLGRKQNIVPDSHARNNVSMRRGPHKRRKLFACTLTAGRGVYVDPFGNMTLCQCLRHLSVNVLARDIMTGVRFLLSKARPRLFHEDSLCNNCPVWQQCPTCPGRAYLETGNEESAVDYFCAVAGRR